MDNNEPQEGTFAESFAIFGDATNVLKTEILNVISPLLSWIADSVVWIMDKFMRG